MRNVRLSVQDDGSKGWYEIREPENFGPSEGVAQVRWVGSLSNAGLLALAAWRAADAYYTEARSQESGTARSRRGTGDAR